MTNFTEEFNRDVLLNPRPLTLIFLCGEKRKLLGIILLFLLPHLDIETCERERAVAKKQWGNSKGWHVFFFLSFFFPCYVLAWAGEFEQLSFPMLEKMMNATSTSHNTVSLCAFFNRASWRLENVTCQLVGFSVLLISIFPRPISSSSSSWRSRSAVSVLLQ
jgi:hypothetical protein